MEKAQQEKTLKIKLSDAQAIANYLQTKPWAEVHTLMMILANLEVVKEDKQDK